MKTTEVAQRLMEAIAHQIALVTYALGAFDRYAPIILNPRRCLDDDLFRVLELNGVSVRPGTLDYAVVRRLAMLAPELKSWRGSFRAHRTVASAITGYPVIVQSWIQQRAVMDVSGMDVVMLEDDDSHITLMFVVVQGPDADSLYSEAELVSRLESMAMPVLDEVQLVNCFALTSWRNGVSGWAQGTGWPEAIPSPVQNEYESADFGEVSADSEQFVVAPTRAPEPTGTTYSWWVTVWFKTRGAVDGDGWEIWLFATDDGPSGGDGYKVRVPVGTVQDLVFSRVNAGVESDFGFESVNLPDGDSGEYHRIDLVAEKTSTKALRIRAYVDHNPTAWYDDPAAVVGRPSGDRLHLGARLSDFTAGRLRVAAVTSSFREP